jgi:hypothetical protein
MVLAFLRAERDSPRFAEMLPKVKPHLAKLAKYLLDSPDLTSPTHNAARAAFLDYRGFRARDLLFLGFPLDVQWRLVSLQADDVERLKYANHETWRGLSAGTRKVTDGAANIDKIQAKENANANVHGIAKRLRKGETFPEIIGIEGANGDPILLEGHARATAYVIEGKLEGVMLILGTSATMSGWAFF